MKHRLLNIVIFCDGVFKSLTNVQLYCLLKTVFFFFVYSFVCCCGCLVTAACLNLRTCRSAVLPQSGAEAEPCMH